MAAYLFVPGSLPTSRDAVIGRLALRMKHNLGSDMRRDRHKTTAHTGSAIMAALVVKSDRLYRMTTRRNS